MRSSRSSSSRAGSRGDGAGSRPGREPGRPGLLALGALGRPHGLGGEVVFRCFNPAGARLEDLELPLPVELRRASEIRAAVVRGARPFKNGSLVRLDGIATRDAATAVTGYHLCVPRTALPPLAEDECYTEDLIGCAVFDLAGKARGRVASVFWNGSHDVLVVLDERGDELLVPVVGDFLASIDLSQSLIVVDPHE